MADIGATLREARMRARIDVSEIEAQTKIRAKYLRALENEEWSLLPGPIFVKSFLRTYAEALGLDGKSLVEEYRLHHERPSETERPEHVQQPLVPSGPGRTPGRAAGARTGGGRAAGGGERSGFGGSRTYLAVVGGVCLVIVLLVLGLLSRNGSSPPASSPPSTSSHKTPASNSSHSSKKSAHHTSHGAPHGNSKTGSPTLAAGYVTLTLTPSEPVWVCLIGDDGNELIPGTILQPGATVVHHAKRRFEIRLGNTALTITVNGKPVSLTPSPAAVDYAITSSGLSPLTSGPECA